MSPLNTYCIYAVELKNPSLLCLFTPNIFCCLNDTANSQPTEVQIVVGVRMSCTLANVLHLPEKYCKSLTRLDITSPDSSPGKKPFNLPESFLMLKSTEFYDVRKSAITLAVGPFAFLLLIILTDLSAHTFVTQQTAVTKSTATICDRDNLNKTLSQ